MSIEVECIACETEIDMPGGLLIGPPTASNEHLVAKYHLCRTCWGELFVQLIDKRVSGYTTPTNEADDV